MIKLLLNLYFTHFRIITEKTGLKQQNKYYNQLLGVQPPKSWLIYTTTLDYLKTGLDFFFVQVLLGLIAKTLYNPKKFI